MAGDDVTSAFPARQLQHYEISAHGHPGELLCSAFPDLCAQRALHDTLLTGAPSHQSTAYGVFAEIEVFEHGMPELRGLGRDRAVPHPRCDSSDSYQTY
jgi:hypothetical protein